MVYSYITHTKHSDYYIIVFENDMEPGARLKIKFLPTTTMAFSILNLALMKMRDPEVLLSQFEEVGLTLILEGLK